MSTSILNLDLKDFKLPAWLKLGKPLGMRSGLRVKYPPVAVDIGTNDFVYARLTREKERKRWSLGGFEIVPIPSELVETEVFRFKIRDPGRFRSLVAAAVHKNGVKTEQISLVVPDHLARVALLAFEELPRSRKEVIELLKWKMKKAVPFKVDEAVVDYQVIPSREKGFTILAILMPIGIVREHESVFRDQGIRPGLIDLSTFSLVHLYRSVIDGEVPAGGDFMLLNGTATFLTAMVFRAGTPIFYRCKTFGLSGVADAEAKYRLFHREIQASLLYYQERLDGKKLARVYMALVGLDPGRVSDLFSDAPTAMRPELIDVRRVVDVDGEIDALEARRKEEVLQRLAPAVGAALGREPTGGAVS
ncbi:MAG: type IV pilus biogenesis protein PilM [Acidobacteriota bacterium]